MPLTIESQPQTGVDPNNYRRILDIGRIYPYKIVELDLQILHLVPGKNTTFRQYILGHHDIYLLAKAKFHQGWQGDEMIREFRVVRQPDGKGGFEDVTQEVDLRKQTQNMSSNRWGKPF